MSWLLQLMLDESGSNTEMQCCSVSLYKKSVELRPDPKKSKERTSFLLTIASVCSSYKNFAENSKYEFLALFMKEFIILVYQLGKFSL